MRSTDKRLPAFLAAALTGALLPWAAGAVPLLISAGPTEEAVPEGERPSAVAVCAQPEESCSSLAGWEALPVAGKETKDIFSDIQLQLQNPELPNGCEVTSLAMLLTAAGYPVDKLELYEYLPREEFSYSGSARLGPNPQEAFAGDPASASGGWYCLEGPVVETGNRWLQSSGGSAEMVNLTGLEQSQLNALLEEGTPLVVWITQEYEEPAYRESFCFNPFVYLRDDNDAQRLVTNLFKSTTPKDNKSSDPFWDTAASMLLMAFVLYLKYEAPPEEQNFSTVMELLRVAEVREEDEEYQSPVDELFDRLEMKQPGHIAVKYYQDYRSGSAKTLKSIQITLAARLEKFNLRTLSALTATDELDLPSLGEKKVALFALIPDNDTSFNFLVSILYTQIFQQLFHLADHKYGGSLPVPVHFLMDEFANVSLPDDFDKLLATMRSRNISVSILLQNIAILGNCDELLYLGGNEASTHKLLSESYLGKSTLWLDSYGESRGRSGSYTTNRSIIGRELLTPDEVRMLDNRYALLFIRGERPLLDEKYDILKHPNVVWTTDGKARPYEHGTTGNAVAGLTVQRVSQKQKQPEPEKPPAYELLSDEELETLFEPKKEESSHEQKTEETHPA